MSAADYKSAFGGKTVTLLGLGLLGRGVGDAAFLARHCKKLYVTDMKSAEDLHPSLEALAPYANIEFRLGGHDFAQFENVDFVVKGAGVRPDNPYVAHAEKNGIPVHMSTALFALFSPIPIVGVTGTRGKTTTTCMIADILKRAGQKILLGGNIRGVSTLALLPDASWCDRAVLELDSWQLQGFDALNTSPAVSVFTNFYPDHMNYYDGDMDRYLADKCAIFRHQKSVDTFVTTGEMMDLLTQKNIAPPVKAVIAEPLPSDLALKVPGEHNRVNAALARAAALAAGVPDSAIGEALRDFEAVEGRLQPAGEWQRRRFYNDSNATTQDATLAALEAFPPDATVLIFGGADKGLPIDRLVGFISDHKIRAVLIGGTGSDRVTKILPRLPVVGTMRDAVKTACALSKPDDNIVLSPAFASFGAFRNEYDRSDQFLHEVGLLIRSAGAA